MLKNLLLIVLLSVVSLTLFGQEKITIKEEAVSDFVPQNFYKTRFQYGYLFKVGEGEYQAIGYKAENLEEVLKNDVIAYKEFEKFKQKITTSKVSFWVGYVGFFGLTLSQNGNDSIEQSRAKWIGSLVSAIGGGTAYFLLNRSAKKHLFNAVEIYNQNLNN